MGSIVEYSCPSCRFSSGKLSIGWGKAGRQAFWGGIARCKPCKKLGVVDLAVRVDEGGRCAQCNSVLVKFDDLSAGIACPGCGDWLRHSQLGTWM